MSSREVGLTGRLNEYERTGECAACASPATHYVIVKDGISRAVKVCSRHESMARTSAHRFFKHIDTKESFLDDPDAAKEDVRRRIERERG